MFNRVMNGIAYGNVSGLGAQPKAKTPGEAKVELVANKRLGFGAWGEMGHLVPDPSPNNCGPDARAREVNPPKIRPPELNMPDQHGKPNPKLGPMQ